MDEFGVLVQSMGFKAHGKSPPLAELKPKPKSQSPARSAVRTVASDDTHSLPVDELDGIFRSNSTTGKTHQSTNFFGGHDLFGSPAPASSSRQYDAVDLESVFSSSNNRRSGGGNSNSRNSAGSNVVVDDLLGSTPERRGPVDDLFAGIGAANSGWKPEKKVHGLDDLMPGFGGSTSSKTKVFMHTKSCPSRSRTPVSDDPFLAFESAASPPDASWPFSKPDQDTGKGSSSQSSLYDFGDFVMGGTRSGCKVGGAGTPSNAPNSGVGSTGVVFVDEIFGGGSSPHLTSGGQRRSASQNSMFDDFFHEEKTPGMKKASSQSPIGKKATPAANVGTDFASLFGDVTTSSGEFHEIEGEPKERRWARLNRLMRTNTRMAEALAEKTKRDLQSRQEQEEKRRLAETMDYSMKRWASGKEGNIRALLSSLQEVLWPECGWRPVSITDMITPESVKKVYKKATLCVHPDKVQQKGATIQQKYIAEKVFDLLKEAWNKFSVDELR